MLPHPHVLLQKLYLSMSVHTLFFGGGGEGDGGGGGCIICSGQEKYLSVHII